MSFKNNNVQYIFLCLLFFLPLKFINAAQLFNNNLIEFSLSVQSQTTHFDFPAKAYQVKSDQVGISWYESFNKYFQAGLEVGFIDMSQIDNPLASAQFSSGQYFGILLRFLPLDYPLASLTLNLNYRYNNTEAKSSNQNSEFAWHETLFFSEVELRPFDKISLILAAEYQDLAGEQRDSGNISQISRFSASEHQGYRFGINFKPYPSADIRIEWLTGYRNGGRIYFKRRF
ncbi:MAG: hypothetical protein KAJ39_03055 [Gammaproteobacteria bacterium]|nr:hypothetical protein [Gammaproteobacteria bacterium]